MMFLLWWNQGFGLGLNFIQPAVQLPLVTRGRLRLERENSNIVNISVNTLCNTYISSKLNQINQSFKNHIQKAFSVKCESSFFVFLVCGNVSNTVCCFFHVWKLLHCHHFPFFTPTFFHSLSSSAVDCASR